MEHVSSVRPTGKFPEKLENLKRWSRFPGWKFRTECRVPFTFLVVLYQFEVHGRAPPRTGVYDQMEQRFTNRKLHFCYHRNFRVFFLNGKRPSFPANSYPLKRWKFHTLVHTELSDRKRFIVVLLFL